MGQSNTSLKNVDSLASTSGLQQIKKLSDRFLSNPKYIEVARPASSNLNIEQFLVDVLPAKKRDVLRFHGFEHQSVAAVVVKIVVLVKCAADFLVQTFDQIGDDNLSHDQRFKVLQMLTRLRQLSCHIGLVDDTWKGSSSKIEVLMEQLEQLKERGNRPLIFSQFVSHLTLIRDACDKAGITYQYLDGQTTPPQRQQ